MGNFCQLFPPNPRKLLFMEEMLLFHSHWFHRGACLLFHIPSRVAYSIYLQMAAQPFPSNKSLSGLINSIGKAPWLLHLISQKHEESRKSHDHEESVLCLVTQIPSLSRPYIPAFSSYNWRKGTWFSAPEDMQAVTDIFALVWYFSFTILPTFMKLPQVRAGAQLIPHWTTTVLP